MTLHKQINAARDREFLNGAKAGWNAALNKQSGNFSNIFASRIKSVDENIHLIPTKPMTEDEIFTALFYLKTDTGEYVFKGTGPRGIRETIRALRDAGCLYVEETKHEKNSSGKEG